MTPPLEHGQCDSGGTASGGTVWREYSIGWRIEKKNINKMLYASVDLYYQQTRSLRRAECVFIFVFHSFNAAFVRFGLVVTVSLLFFSVAFNIFL